MLKRYQHTFGYAFRLIDALVAVAAWLASYWIRFYLPAVTPALEVRKGLPEFASYAALAPLIAVLWVSVFAVMRVYESKRLLGLIREVQLLMKAHALALLLFIGLTYFFEDYRYSRVVMVYFGALSALGIVAFRMTLRTLLRHFRANGFNLRHILAVGEGVALETLVQRLEYFPELGLRVRGVVTHEASELSTIGGKPVLGHFDRISEIIDETRVDEVLIALPPSQGQEMDRLLDLLKNETLDVRIAPDVQRYAALGCEVEDFDGLPIMRINDSPVMGCGAIAKRVTDAVVSAALLAILSPLLLLIALLVRVTSPGPIFYAQERMGLDRRSFLMFKFRSMRADAERTSGAVWCDASDSRRTKLGTFLRKSSLDELPQLWNVLCGDMSLVGPRPERPVFVDKFRNEIPHYMLRHKVRAGITGWAQVNGWRGNTSLDRRIECDLFYIKNWSYILDLKILTMTVWKGFINKNAY